jgi:hypothetical protein
MTYLEKEFQTVLSKAASYISWADKSRTVRHMFVRKITITRIEVDGAATACPIRWIDNFAMRNFTNDAVFDDTLPVADGLLEVGNRVPLDRLAAAMEDWFRRKSYLKPTDRLSVTELAIRRNAAG